jgi:AAA ATPase domain
VVNPFKPTFGASPPLLAGRNELITEFTEALLDGPGSAGRATLYTGARGAGKTVLLNEIEEAAKSHGWIVVSETATPGLIDRLTQSRLPELLRQFDPDAVRRRLTGVRLPFSGGGGLDWETLESHVVKVDLRGQLNLLTDLLAESETGLLITLDEVHRNRIDEMRELATSVQHAFREDRELAFAAAGLSSSISELLQDDVLTFLRRADRYHLGAVEPDEVRRALEDPIIRGGRTVAPDALQAMVEGTQGYPFLIQLVGSHCWRVQRRAELISLADAETGVASARRRLGSLVHAPALKKCSDVDRSFLLAMAEDEGPSKTPDIAKRLEVEKRYVSIYRQRLIDAELIEAVGHGYVEFAVPYLRDYLRENAASLAGPRPA